VVLDGEALRAVPVAADKRRGNRMLENKLFQGVGLKHNRIFIERPHFAGDLHAIQQVNGDVLLAQKRGMKKRFLDVAGKHWRSLPEPDAPPAMVEPKSVRQNSFRWFHVSNI
jgi:hypothetical protein